MGCEWLSMTGCQDGWRTEPPTAYGMSISSTTAGATRWATCRRAPFGTSRPPVGSGGGFSVARHLKELHPACTVVMFSAAPVGHQAADSPDVDDFVMKGDVRVIRRLLDDLAQRVQPDN